MLTLNDVQSAEKQKQGCSEILMNENVVVGDCFSYRVIDKF